MNESYLFASLVSSIRTNWILCFIIFPTAVVSKRQSLDKLQQNHLGNLKHHCRYLMLMLQVSQSPRLCLGMKVPRGSSETHWLGKHCATLPSTDLMPA